MLPVLLSILSGGKTIGKFLIDNWKIVVILIAVLFAGLYFNQLKSTRIAKQKIKSTITIAENNRKALSDSTIVLMLTRKQLAETDTMLSKMVAKLDSLKKNPKIITVIKPIYVPDTISVENQLAQDTNDSTKYGLKFISLDSVRTIEGVSWLNFKNNKIIPANTDITKFSLNFGLSVARYNDENNKTQKIDIQPYYINSSGEFTKPISKNVLNINYRGAELLDVPYEYNIPDNVPGVSKNKYSVKGGFALTLNFVGYGYNPFGVKPEMNFLMPTINIGYGFMIIRNR